MGMDQNTIEMMTDPDGVTRRAIFHCPGCGFLHQVIVEGDQSKMPVWGFNNDLVKPTFTPSVKVTQVYGPQKEQRVCHSFVRNGVIEFCSDTTHALAGQNVPLDPIEDKP